MILKLRKEDIVVVDCIKIWNKKISSFLGTYA